MADRWRPDQGEMTYGPQLVAGNVIAIGTPGLRHKPWVVHEARAEDDGKIGLIVRPVGIEFDYAAHNITLGMGPRAYVHVLPKHYNICSSCGEIPPCAEVWTATVSEAVAKRSARYETAGVCPACQEPITHRQRAHRFDENLYVPLGPPVMFHARSRCYQSAAEYDRQVAKATGRDPLMSCEGLHIHHRDEHHECTNITCPGTHWQHRAYARCYTVSARCNRPECWVLGA